MISMARGIFCLKEQEDLADFCFSPGGNGHLGQTSQRRGLSEADEGDEGFVEEIHFTHQDVGRLRISGDLLHEFIL